MLCWITILGGVLIMMGQHSRSEALFYYFRLEDPASSVFASGTGTNVNSGVLLTNDSQWLLEIAASWGGSFVTSMPSALA